MKCLPKSLNKIEEDKDLVNDVSETYESDIETIELEVTASGNQYLKWILSIGVWLQVVLGYKT